MIGADGARSAVRESTGLSLEGPRTSDAYVIVDIAEDDVSPLPLERIFHYEHPNVGFRNVLLVPFAGHWRVDLQCRSDDDPDAFSSGKACANGSCTSCPRSTADRVTWVSSLHFRQAIASAFTDQTRHVLLVGEAAHLFAPFGARGLNSGVADAVMAARAVDSALSAAASDSAARFIQEFADARHAAAARNRAASSSALTHLQAGVTRAQGRSPRRGRTRADCAGGGSLARQGAVRAAPGSPTGLECTTERTLRTIYSQNLRLIQSAA